MLSWSKRGWMLVCCLTVAVLGASTALAATLHWSIQNGTANGSRNAQLTGVDCTSTRSCLAVGVTLDKRGFHGPLAERWRGKRWTVLSPPVPRGAKSAQLFDVSCASSTRCMAAGRYTTASGLTTTFSESWNGKKWAIPRTPTPAGTRRSSLRGISCPSKSSCVTVGAFADNKSFKTLAERWNGRAWSIQKTPNPAASANSELVTVSCTSSRACIAVGDFVDRTTGTVKALAELWNGQTWAIQELPLPSGSLRSQLVGVSCAGPSTCEAIGYYTNSTGASVGFAEGWSGSRWTMQTTAAPAGATQVAMIDVACTSGTGCTAVGQAINRRGTETTLAETWDGTTWRLQGTPTPRGATRSLFNAVACRLSTSCVAVGGSGTKNGSLLVPLAERSS
jgi:hypothetical protein